MTEYLLGFDGGGFGDNLGGESLLGIETTVHLSGDRGAGFRSTSTGGLHDRKVSNFLALGVAGIALCGSLFGRLGETLGKIFVLAAKLIKLKALLGGERRRTDAFHVLEHLHDVGDGILGAIFNEARGEGIERHSHPLLELGVDLEKQLLLGLGSLHI